MKYSYWVSYQVSSGARSGFGAIGVTFEKPLGLDDMGNLAELIQKGIDGSASVVVLAISKFES